MLVILLACLIILASFPLHQLVRKLYQDVMLKEMTDLISDIEPFQLPQETHVLNIFSPLILQVISFVYIENRIGNKTHPCGTPVFKMVLLVLFLNFNHFELNLEFLFIVMVSP